LVRADVYRARTIADESIVAGDPEKRTRPPDSELRLIYSGASGAPVLEHKLPSVCLQVAKTVVVREAMPGSQQA
jgi:hypothetical protein